MKPLYLQGKLGQVVYAESFLQFGYFTDNLLKTILAEQFVLLVLEFFAQGLILLGRYQGPEGREKNRILPGRMGPIHSQKLAKCFPEPAA